MTDNPTKKEIVSTGKSTEVDIRAAKNLISRSCMMADLLYEMKAETPAGKTFKILVNLFNEDRKCPKGTIHLKSISTNLLAQLAGINEDELLKALDYLQDKNIITYGANTQW